MTHDEMERAIEFILHQQAKSDAKSEEWYAKFQRSLDALLQQQAKTSSELAQLASFGTELAKGQVRLQNKMAELAEAQSETKKELKAFIAAMNRRPGGNGRGRKSA